MENCQPRWHHAPGIQYGGEVGKRPLHADILSPNHHERNS